MRSASADCAPATSHRVAQCHPRAPAASTPRTDREPCDSVSLPSAPWEPAARCCCPRIGLGVELRAGSSQRALARIQGRRSGHRPHCGAVHCLWRRAKFIQQSRLFLRFHTRSRLGGRSSPRAPGPGAASVERAPERGIRMTSQQLGRRHQWLQWQPAVPNEIETFRADPQHKGVQGRQQFGPQQSWQVVGLNTPAGSEAHHRLHCPCWRRR
jgi:hypothetical protein